MKHSTVLRLGREPLRTIKFSELLNTGRSSDTRDTAFDIVRQSSIEEMDVFPTCSSLVWKDEGETWFPAVKDLSKTGWTEEKTPLDNWADVARCCAPVKLFWECVSFLLHEKKIDYSMPEAPFISWSFANKSSVQETRARGIELLRSPQLLYSDKLRLNDLCPSQTKLKAE